MYWKRAGKTDYLIRISTKHTQKSLGPRTAETEAIYTQFFAKKTAAEEREAALRETIQHHQRLNRALHVGRAPTILVDILNVISTAGLSDCFTVVGTHALYAFEMAAGVRIMDSSAMETRDVDLLWHAKTRSVRQRHKIARVFYGGFVAQGGPTFAIRHDQKYTATNSKGFEVDIIRREIEGDDPHPVRLSEAEDGFGVTQAGNAGVLLSAPRFSSVIVSASGRMARMDTISPVVFSRFKRWLSEQPDRDPLKKLRDLRQAEVVDALVDEYLPHLRAEQKQS